MKKTLPETKLYWLNKSNATARHQYDIVSNLSEGFPNEKIVALEIGSPYGGAVEMMATVLKNRGTVYGYDTFEGHPKDLADDPHSLEATCMEAWYHHSMLGREGLAYDYQRQVLDSLGLDNAILVKGRINEHSFDDIEKIHFAMLDLDLIKPTRVTYEAIKDKFVKGSYLFIHDALPSDHLPYIHNFVYDEIIPSGLWSVEVEDPQGLLVVLKRK